MQVPEVEDVKVAVDVELLNAQPVAVPFATEYVYEPVPEPPLAENVGVAVYEVPLQAAAEVT